MIEKIREVLVELGYFNIHFYRQEQDELHFEAESDSYIQIKVKMDYNKLSIYDRYVGEKRYVHVKDIVNRQLELVRA